MPVVCVSCGIENREAARFCRGCGARVAAVVASAPPDNSGDAWQVTQPIDLSEGRAVIRGATTVAQARMRAAALCPPAPPAPPEPRRGPARLLLMAVCLAGLLMLAGAAGYWVHRLQSAPPVVVPVVPVAVVPPVPVRSPEPLPREAVAELAPLPVTPPVVQAPPPAELRWAAPTPAARSVPRKAGPARAEPNPLPVRPPPAAAPVQPAPAPAPEVACAGRNFIAKARCMAAECARPGVQSQPQCEAVRQQQRLEEEKRNPSLVN